MKINALFSVLLLTALITLPANAMEQQAAHISNQQAMQIAGGLQIYGQGMICVEDSCTMIINGILVPAGMYNGGNLQNWIKQERLNNSLWLAVAQDKPIAEVAALIAAGADVNHVYNNVNDEEYPTQTIEGETPLHRATRNMNLQIIQLLLDAGVQVNNETSTDKYTPLDLAMQHKRSSFYLRKFHMPHSLIPISPQEHTKFQEIIALLQAHGAHANALSHQ